MTTSRRRATKHVQRVSPYSPASIDPGFVEIGLVQLSQLRMEKTASVASFSRPVLCLIEAQKKVKKTTHHRHQQSSQPPPEGIPLLQNCEAALERVSDPLGARGNILAASVGSAPTWSERVSTILKRCNPHLVLLPHPPWERAPRASQSTRWPLDVV